MSSNPIIPLDGDKADGTEAEQPTEDPTEYPMGDNNSFDNGAEVGEVTPCRCLETGF
jgi:hypothetical protein